mgnify:FL=1
MKHNSTISNQTKLSRKIVSKVIFTISWLVIFPIIVIAGIIDVVIKHNKPSKVNDNFQVYSDQSKIVPKNTKDKSKS